MADLPAAAAAGLQVEGHSRADLAADLQEAGRAVGSAAAPEGLVDRGALVAQAGREADLREAVAADPIGWGGQTRRHLATDGVIREARISSAPISAWTIRRSMRAAFQ